MLNTHRCARRGAAALLALCLPLLCPAQGFVPDTIGGTLYDWQANGPSRRWIAFDSLTGVHATWTFSNDTLFADRGMRYNFLDLATGRWTMDSGPDHMTSGMTVFPERNGLGALDINPVTRDVYIVSQIGNTSVLARRHSPGPAAFDFCPGWNAFWFPTLGITGDGQAHVATIDGSTMQEVFYFRIADWDTWTTPLNFSDSDALSEDYCIEATKNAGAIALSWIRNRAPPTSFLYKVSLDAGASWSAQLSLDPPPAFTPGSETLPSFHYSSNGLLWDHDPRLHIVVAVIPVTGGIAWRAPVEIWHWRSSPPHWSRVHRAGCDTSHWAGLPGNAAVYAGRPMLAIDETGCLFCVWEQFDSLNVEPATGKLRADLFAAWSPDNGTTWSEPVNLTVSDNTSHRYPSLARDAQSGRIHLLYEQDLQAGFFARSQGQATRNPIVYLTGILGPTGLAAGPAGIDPGLRLDVAPAQFRDLLAIRFSVPIRTQASLSIFDRVGRLVRNLDPPESGQVAWDGRDDLGRPLPSACYFIQLCSPTESRTRAVIKLR